MSKRFIDTGIFDDDWFMDLPKDAKLLWIYFITKCDHAGIIKLNIKLCKLQTDIKDLPEIIKQLGNRLVTVSEHLYFIPKFIEFQYPGFPNSKVRQQQSAVEILSKHGLFDKENLTLTKQLDNSYEHEHDTVIDNGNEPESTPKISFSKFWDAYLRKEGAKAKCETKWNNLKNQEREKIIKTLPSFFSKIKDKQFYPYPETYLNQRRWENEPDLIEKPIIYDDGWGKRIIPEEIVYRHD